MNVLPESLKDRLHFVRELEKSQSVDVTASIYFVGGALFASVVWLGILTMTGGV